MNSIIQTEKGLEFDGQGFMAVVTFHASFVHLFTVGHKVSHGSLSALNASFLAEVPVIGDSAPLDGLLVFFIMTIGHPSDIYLGIISKPLCSPTFSQC